MLLPKEKPYMDGLNSYYLAMDKFIEHLQGEIGTGCLYCRSSTKEILVYFDEMDVIRAIIHDSGEKAQLAATLNPVFEALEERNYIVSVYHLDPHAIFYWAQLPPYKRVQRKLDTDVLSLEELVGKLGQKKTSCFVEVIFTGTVNMNCILFFNMGEFVGGSYAWGAGGLNPSRNEFESFLHAAGNKKAEFVLGRFTGDELMPAAGQIEEKQEEAAAELAGEDQVFISNLPTLLEEFLAIFCETARKKAKVDPYALMLQQIVVRSDQYPFLDPFYPPFDYTDNVFTFTGTDKAFGENTARAIIECSWDVVGELRLEKKFRAALSSWDSRTILEERSYTVLR